MYETQIRKIIAEETAVSINDIHLELPQLENFGDYSTNIALRLANIKKLRGNEAKDFANEIVTKLKTNTQGKKIFEKIETAGPGFINFWIKKELLFEELNSINTTKDEFNINRIGKGKTVVIDYSSPNIAKPFGIGHLRSTIIGQALYNLYKLLGYKVVGDNHLGDWGTQFGKLLYMIQKNNLSEKDLTIDKLENLYVEFHKLSQDDPDLEEEARKWFKRLEDGDKKARKLWNSCVSVSLEEFDRIYELIGVKIDYRLGESFYEDAIKELDNDENVKKHLTSMNSPSQGWVIDLTGNGISTPLMFKKSDGATTYATRDLATIRYRVQKWNPDIIIYEVGVEQTLHFQQVFAAARELELVGKNTELRHVAHGLYLSENGKKFSTREGKTVKLEDILDESIKRAQNIIEKSETSRGMSDTDIKKTSRIVGVGAIKYFDLMHQPGSEIRFSWEKMFLLEGNSGPYLQYTYVRTQSVLKKAGSKLAEQVISDYQPNEMELSLLRYFIRFPGVISDAAKTYSPNLLCNYLYELASKFNAFYAKYKILPSDEDESSESSFRLSLTNAAGRIIKEGLDILGIGTPEKM